jgi:hypothetical protein
MESPRNNISHPIIFGTTMTTAAPTYFATRLAGGSVFETKRERAEFLKRAGPGKGSPVGNIKNFTMREEATAYSQSDMVVMWPRAEEENRHNKLLERVDLLEGDTGRLRLEAEESQANYEAAKAVIREHGRTQASQAEEITRLYESLCLQQSKTSAAEGLCRAVRAQEEASRERTQTLRAWLRASLDVLSAHTDEAPESLTASHLSSQGKADMAASDIVSELGDPVPLNRTHRAGIYVSACVFLILIGMCCLGLGVHVEGDDASSTGGDCPRPQFELDGLHLSAMVVALCSMTVATIGA